MEILSNVTSDLAAVRTLYEDLLVSWNGRNASEFADFFTEDGNMIGFDGSQVNGREEIKQHLSDIFDDHRTATFVAIVREVKPISPTTYILRGIAGMVSPGESDVNAELNAVHSLVAVKGKGGYGITLFQSTPASLHGRPATRDQMTLELSKTYRELKQTHQIPDDD